MATRRYDFARTVALLEDLRSERSEWEAEWRTISDYLLPGRGIYQTYAKPRKRRLTSGRVVNATAEDALYVLTSGMHGGLTSPSRPWFRLEWRDSQIQNQEPLKAWLQDCTERLHTELQRSNFYAIINSFYIEYAGFGNGSIYVGSDTNTDDVAFWFHLLTAGEYYVAMGPDGRPDTFIRTIFATPKQVYDRYGSSRVSRFIREQVNDRRPSMHETYITLIELVVKEKFQDKPWTRYVFEGTTSGPQSGQPILTDIDGGSGREALETTGFYEFPYPFSRWGTIGSDVYGIGPGARAIPDIKRLQEIEKAVLMATHKSVNPPLNIPVRMKGRVNQLPGGYNYYSNPNEMVTELYRVNFDIQGAGYMIERIEGRIKQNFFNDIFLTSARDPNASPLKATQVEVQEQEKMLRLGPVIERLQHEFFMPLLERCFNIMLRKGKFAALSPELQQMAGEYEIALVSPLATAQRAVALQGINSFMAFLGNAAQFDPTILDNIDPDAAAREYADITGVQIGVLRPEKDVAQIRQQRAQAQAQQQAAEQAAAATQIQGEATVQDATARKAAAEASVAQVEARQKAQEMGMI